jgi:hypothetical protein
MTMYRPESPLPKARAPERPVAETKASPHEPKAKSKYMNFADALQAMIERAEARRLVRESSETNFPH